MIDLYRPAVFRTDSGVSGGFTLRNPQIGPENLISGLHFNGALPDEKERVWSHYRLLGQSQGFDAAAITWVTQVHGDIVKSVQVAGHHGDGDGLVTATPGLVLTVRVADCAAILLADASAGVIGAVHAGWRGARSGILGNAIRSMCGLGARTDSMVAYISPCISTANFEVGEEVASQFPEQYVVRRGFEKPHVDLKRYLTDELLSSGLARHSIETDERCTVEDGLNLYSYRREGAVSGRMVGFIRIGS